MPQIILVGEGWTARTLLRAQLIEEGLEVEAYESVQVVVAGLQAGRVLPGLLAADLYRSENPTLSNST